MHNGQSKVILLFLSMDPRELGIGIVPYSPIGRGFFGGRGVTEQVSAESNLVPRQPSASFAAVNSFQLLRLCSIFLTEKAPAIFSRKSGKEQAYLSENGRTS